MRKPAVDLRAFGEGRLEAVNPQLNKNVVVVGGTGTGKTESCTLPTILHTYNSSMVVPITKKKVRVALSKYIAQRGYKVLNLDFAHPEQSDIGYNPLDYMKEDEDILKFADALMESTDAGHKDEAYWQNASRAVIAALIELAMLNAKTAKVKASMRDVLDLFNVLEYSGENKTTTNLDALFEKSAELHPNSSAYKRWKTFNALPDRTANCVYSYVASYFSIFSEDVLKLMDREDNVDFVKLGQEKTLLFITTSPMNKALQPVIHVMYGDLFYALFQEAESRENSELEVPVHVICDDFATGGRIADFDEYISIFRAARISVTLLLQSESQLAGMYGENKATTIINNCDTYIYFGGNDLQTCRNIGTRINKPVEKILSMELGKIVICQRGLDPMMTNRYPTYEDPEYKKMMALYNRANNQEMRG